MLHLLTQRREGYRAKQKRNVYTAENDRLRKKRDPDEHDKRGGADNQAPYGYFIPHVHGSFMLRTWAAAVR